MGRQICSILPLAITLVTPTSHSTQLQIRVTLNCQIIVHYTLKDLSWQVSDYTPVRRTVNLLNIYLVLS